MQKLFLISGAISGFLGVAAGAFGAHGLKKTMAPDLFEIFEVGVRYQMYHALALIVVGALLWKGRAIDMAGWGFLIGTIIFSGSLYALSLSGQRWFGAITPIGGVAFLIGWAALAWAALQRPQAQLP